MILISIKGNLALLAKYLSEDQGFKLDTLNDPLVASDVLEGFYDQVMLYIKMPNINGFDSYGEIKKIILKLRCVF